jgi:Short C-terminal domain
MGLIGGMARTAVVAGTATAVSNRVSRRQAGRWAAQESEQAPPPQYAQEPAQQYQAPPPQPVYVAAPPAASAAATSDDIIEQLQKLGRLRDQGILSDAEFEAQKARVLAS